MKRLYSLFISICISGVLFAGNIVSNGDFELTSKTTETFWYSAGLGHKFTIEEINPLSGKRSGKSTIEVLASGLTKQSLYTYIMLPKEAVYKVSISLSSTTDLLTGVQAVINRSYGDFGWMANSPIVSIEANIPKTIDFEITTPKENTGLCKLSLYFGKLPVGHSILIDNVSITEKNPVIDKNLCNGDFESKSGNVIYTFTDYISNGIEKGVTHNKAQCELYCGWSFLKYNDTSADISIQIDSSASKITQKKSLKVMSINTPTTMSDDYILAWVLGGVKNQNYIVSFKAKSSINVSIDLLLQCWTLRKDQNSVYIPEQSIKLTPKVQLYTFTTETPFNNPDGRLVLKFLLGKLPKGVSVWFDDFFISTKES